MEFDAEFKFAKIQNSHLVCVCVGGVLRNMMLSSNLLKSKIPIWGGGGRGWWNQFPTFNAEFKYAKKNLKKNFFEKFSKFSGKNVPGNGFRL